MRLIFAAALMLLLGACTTEAHLAPGEYQGVNSTMVDAHLGVKLTISADKKTAIVSLADGSQVELKLIAVPVKEWELGCPTQWSPVAMETYRVEQEVVKIGKLELRNVKLTAGCLNEQPEAILEGDHQGGHHSVILRHQG